MSKETDYSFMKTGNSMIREPASLEEIDEMYIASLLTLFTSNAIVNAKEYSDLCERNGITKEDMRYGLIYEVFEFLNNPNLVDDLREVEKQLEEEEIYSDDEEEELEELLTDDNIEDFNRISKEKIEELENEDKEFINKIHKYYDEWDEWQPKNDLETILKNAIDKTK